MTRISATSRFRRVAPLVLAALLQCSSGLGQGVTEFPVESVGSVAAGPDGAMWFTSLGKVGRIDTAGAITEFPTPTAGDSQNLALTFGSDGNLWFTGIGRISRMTTSGVVNEFPLPDLGMIPSKIASGPDGNLWFTAFHANFIGRIATSGVITEFPLPRSAAGLAGIAAGPDGNLWFTENTASKIGRITTDGAITEFALPRADRFPAGIAAGPDGNLWFAERAGVGRIAPTGEVAEFPVSSGEVFDVAAGADGNMWFVGWGEVHRVTTSGVVTTFSAIPTYEPHGVAISPDGAIWVAGRFEDNSQIVRFEYQIPSARDVSVGSDNKVHLLFATPGGQLVFRTVDSSGNSTSGERHGPFNGWSPKAAADAADGLTRVLWNNIDGSAALWLYGASGNQASFRLGPVAGWTAVDVAAGAPGTTHILWTHADGRVGFWAVDNSGHVSYGPKLPADPGWTAVAIADGADGLTWLLWNNVDGSAGLSLVERICTRGVPSLRILPVPPPGGLLATYRYGGSVGWRAVDVVVGADGQARMLWKHADGRMALWRVDVLGNVTARGPVYDAPAGFKASRVGAGPDGLTRVLWTDPDGSALLWQMSADNVYQQSFPVGPN